MKRIYSSLIALAVFSMTVSPAFSKENISYGVVNFPKCATESNYGKKEHDSFESLRIQMTSLITDLENQLKDIANKFNDPDFVDSLSPQAEQELKSKFQTLNEELNRQQNQYMQVMQQANTQLMQNLNILVQKASTEVASQKTLSLIVRQEACFAYDETFDVTDAVIAQMNSNFANEKNTNEKDQ